MKWMDDIKKDPFEEYIRQSEPSKRELGYAWYTAMGLQAVDGLEASDYISNCGQLPDNLPIPEFTVNPSDNMVKFTAPEDRIVHGTERVTDKVTDGVTDGESATLQLLEIDPGYTYTAMSVILKLSRKTVSERIKK